MILIRRENFKNNEDMMEFLKNISSSIIEEKKKEYKSLFYLYKTNSLEETKQQKLLEYLEFLRDVEGLEFDKDGNLID